MIRHSPSVGVHPLRQPSSQILALLLVALVSLLVAVPAQAQPSGRHSETPAQAFRMFLRGSTAELPSALRTRLSSRARAALRAYRADRKQAQMGGASRRAIAGRPEVSPSQSFALSTNPDPSRNLGRFFTLQLRRAGDINGDGTADYLYNATLRFGSFLISGFARDERTPQLEDRTGKTVVYFGGTPDDNADQFFYRDLRPVGDLNGDGFADAVTIDAENSSVRLYTGSTSGYEDSGVTLSLNLNFFAGGFFRTTRAFTDLDGDGFDDVLIGKTLGNEIEVLYGASSLQDATTQRYELEGGFFGESTYNTADLNGSGEGEIVRLFGSDPVSWRVYAVTGDQSLETVQTFDVEELGESATEYRLSLVEMNGQAPHEIVASAFDTTRVFRDTSGTDSLSYDSTPVLLGGPAGEASGRPVPVGDLDGDGRHDFSTTAPGGARYISYGPPSLSDGLSFDTQLPTDPGTEIDASFLPTGTLGDVTGNGRTDVILQLLDDTDDEIGRRVVSVTSSRDVGSSVDVRVPQDHVFSGVSESNELGDVNGDQTADFAVTRPSLDQIEVYYGGASISETPDQTLQIASDTLAPVSLSGGDVIGDAASDVVVGYRAGERIDVYTGGGALGPAPDYTLRAADVGAEALYRPTVVGDVNDDGTADLLVSNRGHEGTSGPPERLFLLFGGSSLPTQPDRTIEYADTSEARHVLAGLGDVNGDGVGDFAVGRPDRSVSGETAEGQVDVYFGGGSASFDAPDATLRPKSTGQTIDGFGEAVASGDFDGDGVNDLATRPTRVDPSSSIGAVTISVYHGGSAFDDQADQRLALPASALQPTTPASGRGDIDENGDGLADNDIRGRLEGLSGPPGGADALLLASDAAGEAVNALLYQPQLTSTPTRVLRAPNEDADLGGEGQNVAIGDVTGNGTPDAVLVQHNDGNDAAVSSRFYRYTLGDFPVAATSLLVDSTGTFDFEGTGVDLRFGDLGSPGRVTVQKYDDGPTDTTGIGKSNVSNYRFVIGSESGFSFDTTQVQLAVGSLDGIDDPGAVTIYTRPDGGSGAFDSLKTTVGRAGTPGDISDDTLYATTTSFSEFVLASDSEPLPVELTHFDATADAGTVRLTWQTASETGNVRFEIQRRVVSANGQAPVPNTPWTTVGAVDGAGTASTTQSYRFADTELPYEAGRLQYRLRQVDVDGSTHLSNVVSIRRGVTEAELLPPSPNPASQRALIRYAVPGTKTVTLRLYDVLGRTVRTIRADAQGGRHKMSLDVRGLPSGTYFLRLRTKNAVKTRRLTVTR